MVVNLNRLVNPNGVGVVVGWDGWLVGMVGWDGWLGWLVGWDGRNLEKTK